MCENAAGSAGSAGKDIQTNKQEFKKVYLYRKPAGSAGSAGKVLGKKIGLCFF